MNETGKTMRGSEDAGPAPEEKRPKPEQDQEAAKRPHDDEPTPSRGSAHEAPQSPVHYRGSSDPQRHPDDDSSERRWQKIATTATWVIALAAIVNTGVAVYQRQLTQEATRVAREAATSQGRLTEEANRVARQSADAAQEAAVIARRSLELAERPWLIFQGIRLSGSKGKELILRLAPDQPTELRFMLKNSGKTPALNVRMCGGYELRHGNFPARPKCEGERSAYPSTIVVGPGDPQEVDVVVRGLTTQQLGVITRGERTLYVFARVDYSDHFKNARWSMTCTFYDYTRQAISWHLCDRYNDAE